MLLCVKRLIKNVSFGSAYRLWFFWITMQRYDIGDGQLALSCICVDFLAFIDAFSCLPRIILSPTDNLVSHRFHGLTQILFLNTNNTNNTNIFSLPQIARMNTDFYFWIRIRLIKLISCTWDSTDFVASFATMGDRGESVRSVRSVWKYIINLIFAHGLTRIDTDFIFEHEFLELHE